MTLRCDEDNRRSSARVCTKSTLYNSELENLTHIQKQNFKFLEWYWWFWNLFYNVCFLCTQVFVPPLVYTGGFLVDLSDGLVWSLDPDRKNRQGFVE
jgi:hypothetical protein